MSEFRAHDGHPDPPDHSDPLLDGMDMTHGTDGPAPDLTRRIMGELGYMRVAPAVARRRRRRRMLVRTLACAVMGGCVLVGFHVRRHGSEMRRPETTSVPAAVDQELQQRREGLNRTFRMIRQLAPKLPPIGEDASVPSTPGPAVPPAPESDSVPMDDSIERSGMGPVGWA